jgi:hypothetical protein
MTETQAASGAAGAPTNPVSTEAADGSESAGANATGRAAVGRATVPAEAQPPKKYTRPPGMVPPPDKLESPDQADEEKADSADGVGSAAAVGSAGSTNSAGSSSSAGSTGSAGDFETARVATPGTPTSGRASVAGSARVGIPPLGTGPATGLKPGARPAGTGRSPFGGAKVADAMRAARSTMSSAAARGPRRARLFVKRIDPWSVMKFSFAVSFVLFFVAIVATSVLYLALDAMGVFRSLNKMLADMLGATGGKSTFKITALGVIGTAGVLGLVNVVLFTALSTLGAFIYNVCADLVGGIEVTLSEKD